MRATTQWCSDPILSLASVGPTEADPPCNLLKPPCVSHLATHATKAGKSLDAVLTAAYAEEVKALLKPGGEFESAAAAFEAKKDWEIQAKLQAKFDQRVEAMLKH